MSTHIVRSEDEHDALASLVAEYEESLSPDLRHADTPVVDGTSNVAILASVDGVASACVFVSRFDDESAIIQRLYVRPAARGKGLARALMQHATEHAVKNGYRRLILDTDKIQLQPAYQLYRSLGFSECAPFGEVSYDNPTFMELRVPIDPM